MRSVKWPIPAVTDPRVLRAVRILEDAHFIVPTVAELAEAAELSPDYFLKIFKEATGTTPIDYLRKSWLDQAAFRLSTTDDPIAGLYADFGYLSQAAFTRAFSRRHGVSPKAYQAAARAASAEPPPHAVSLRRIASRSCWTRRYLGPFADRQRHWADFLDRLPPGLGEAFIGLNHDDPRVRSADELRYDCCAVSIKTLGAEEEIALVADGFQQFLTTAGLYACCAYEGAVTGVGRAYSTLLGGWMPRQQQYVIAGEPILEMFGSEAEALRGGDVRLDVGIKVALRGAAVDWTAGPNQRTAAAGDNAEERSD